MPRSLVPALLVFLSTAALAAPAPLPPPPPMPPPAAPSDFPPPPPPPPIDGCAPACRAGFACQNGACVSACNPPCGAGSQCQPNGSCSTAGAPAAPSTEGRVGASGEVAPTGFHYEKQRRKGMLITGPILLGVGFVLSVYFGYFSFSNVTGLRQNSDYLWFLVPVAGPVIGEMLVTHGLKFVNAAELLFTVVVTALQVTGALLTVLGLPARQVLVPNDPDAPPPSERDSRLPPVQWSLAPGAPGAPLGLTLSIRN